MYICFIIGINEIADLDIDFKSNYNRLRGLSNRKDKNIDKSLLLVV